MADSLGCSPARTLLWPAWLMPLINCTPAGVKFICPAAEKENQYDRLQVDQGIKLTLAQLVRLVGAGPYAAALAREVGRLAENAIFHQ